MALHQRVFFLLIVLLPTQLGLHFWPDWATVLGRRVDYLSPTLYLTDILIFLLLLFWFWGQVSRFKIYDLRIKQWQILLGLFIGANIYFSVNQPIAIYKWFKVLEFAGLGYYLVKTKPSLSLVTYYLSFGVLYSSILAIAQFFLQRSLGGPLWWLGERTFTAETPGIAQVPLRLDLGFRTLDFGLKLRPYAAFPHPNVLGGYLAATLPLLMNVPIRLIRPILPINETIIRILKWITVSLGFVAWVLTFSRSAWVVGGMAMVIAIARIKKKPIILYLLFLIPLLVALVRISPQEEAVVIRQQLNAAAIRLWQQSPLFGVGLGNFLVKLPETLPSRQIYFLQPVHNIYLLLLSEIGVVGVGLVAMWAVSRVNYELRIRKYGKDKTKAIIHNSLFIILVLGFIDHYPLTLQQGQLLLTLLLGLSIHPSR